MENDSESHSHGQKVHDWTAWLSNPSLLVTLATLAVALAATVAGLIVLWPDGSGTDSAISHGADIGLGAKRLDATVRAVRDGPCSYATDDNAELCRDITVTLANGSATSTVVLPDMPLAVGSTAPNVKVGDAVVVDYEPSTNVYFYADRNRRSVLGWLSVLFALVVVALGRRQGVRALVAMGLSVMVLIGFVARSVLDGHDPLLVAVVAASAVAFLSLFLTHGINPTTAVALAGTLAALALTFGISWVSFALSHFTGLASEEGLTLPLIANINLTSLLLGGAMLGALGALDDVTVTQVATVAELRRRNPSLSRAELMASGIRVGREHIASTVNTLLLAYAGASMPLLLLFAVSNQSLLSIANSEQVAVEIVRTLCGSIGLVAAVPITTALASLSATE